MNAPSGFILLFFFQWITPLLLLVSCTKEEHHPTQWTTSLNSRRLDESATHRSKSKTNFFLHSANQAVWPHLLARGKKRINRKQVKVVFIKSIKWISDMFISEDYHKASASETCFSFNSIFHQDFYFSAFKQQISRISTHFKACDLFLILTRFRQKHANVPVLLFSRRLLLC